MKIDCAANIFGYRQLFSTDPNKELHPDDVRHCNFEFNRITILFADNAEVRNALTAFHLQQTDSNFLSLLRSLCDDLQLSKEQLSDTYLTQILTLRVVHPQRPIPAQPLPR